MKNRKGANNSLTAGPDDPGSPWAIGSELGGHEAIEPCLGDVASFEALVAAAREQGMEIALDFAIQCSADHPWLKEHPEWFNHRPDGTLKYAENPPKKYQDIYNLNFDSEDWKALWEALRDIVALWVERGVRVFRVDNPHTKPLPFWEWLIADIRATHPDVIFLAEAFTRRAKMMGLAKLGFSQSYTYFTWKNWKWELTQYVDELAYEDGRLLPPELLRQHAGHPHRVPGRGRPARLRGAPRPRRHALADLRDLLRLRELRERARETRQRGVPGLGEVPAARALPRRPAAAAGRDASTSPPREPGAPVPLQRRLARHRERRC